MIAVIADDFTGAAELAGIGLRYGLKIQLAMPGLSYSGADVFIISTDSRSLNKEDAIKVTGDVVKEVIKLEPDFIYKKIDSVLRGHVLDELYVQMENAGLNKAFVLPANPSLKRTIKDGSYYIDGTAINETGFATDPEFAITDSSVLKMIGAVGEERVLKQPGSLPPQGIVIGEAETMDEIKAWADKISDNWVLAGAGDFFTALLDRRFKELPQPEPVLELPHLYVSGTSFVKSREFVKEVQEKRGCVAYLSLTMLQTGIGNDRAWMDRVNEILEEQKKCIVAIPENTPSNFSALHLRNTMAKAVSKVVEHGNIKELFIEGGSTAAAIFDALNMVSFEPVNEMQRGVVRMKVKELYITVKPGSYELPPQLIKLYS